MHSRVCARTDGIVLCVYVWEVFACLWVRVSGSGCIAAILLFAPELDCCDALACNIQTTGLVRNVGWPRVAAARADCCDCV